jgi:hypothetical protein
MAGKENSNAHGIMVALLTLGVLLQPGSALAAVTSDLTWDVATGPGTDWTLVQLGGGVSSRTGMTFNSNGQSFYYTQDFSELDSGNAFSVNAVVSTPLPLVGNEVGARLGVFFKDSSTGGETYKVEARFENDTSLGPVVRLYDVAGGGPACSAR